MADSYRAPSGGPTHGIADPIVAKEIRSLWQAVNARVTGPDSAKFVTIDDLNAAKREVLGKIPVTEQKAFRQDIGGSGGSSAAVVGGASSDLLHSNNTWTGTNWYTRKTISNAPTMRLQSYNSGTIVPVGGPTIMLDTGYQAMLDIRKTSSAQVDAVSGGGNAALYVQHRVDATTATIANVNCGIRVQMESWQRSTHPTNDVVAGYFGLYNHGINSGGFGTHVDLYHAGTGNTVSYGSSVECYREFLDGKVIAFHARVSASGSYSNAADWAFLASPEYVGAVTGFKTVFGAGSDYIGNLNCEIGLDLAYANCSVSAIRVQGGSRIQLNGSANNVGLFFDPVGKVQFFSNVGNTISIGNDASLRVPVGGYIEHIDGSYGSLKTRYDSSALAITYNDQKLYEFHLNGVFGILQPETSATAGAEMGYFVINLGGFLRKVRFSAM